MSEEGARWHLGDRALPQHERRMISVWLAVNEPPHRAGGPNRYERRRRTARIQKVSKLIGFIAIAAAVGLLIVSLV